jgi:hypothetical protein
MQDHNFLIDRKTVQETDFEHQHIQANEKLV